MILGRLGFQNNALIHIGPSKSRSIIWKVNKLKTNIFFNDEMLQEKYNYPDRLPG